MVISYGYLWHPEHRAGRQKGVKDRPCVIIIALQKAADGAALPPRLFDGLMAKLREIWSSGRGQATPRD